MGENLEKKTLLISGIVGGAIGGVSFGTIGTLVGAWTGYILSTQHPEITATTEYLIAGGGAIFGGMLGGIIGCVGGAVTGLFVGNDINDDRVMGYD